MKFSIISSKFQNAFCLIPFLEMFDESLETVKLWNVTVKSSL